VQQAVWWNRGTVTGAVGLLFKMGSLFSDIRTGMSPVVVVLLAFLICLQDFVHEEATGKYWILELNEGAIGLGEAQALLFC
jgi:sorbitol-specific phosphotransferase system component IIC